MNNFFTLSLKVGKKLFQLFLCHGRNALHQNVNTRVVVELLRDFFQNFYRI